ncbi:MAG: auxin efflux carrier [Candidatus Sumerlaea sp.]|nr:MAG: auxin efflux carrier [Candidatus Sumerlaea sp.]
MVSFQATIGAILGVFLLGALGYFAFRRRLISQHGLTEISRVLIDLCLPAALFYAMFVQYDPTKTSVLWFVGSAQLLFLVVGMLAMWGLATLWRPPQPIGTLCGLASLQNNVYLPLPIALAVLGPSKHIEVQFVIGCFVLFFTPILWSVGVVLLTRSHTEHAGWWSLAKKGLNPPFFAAIAGLGAKMLWLNTGWQSPKLLLDVLQMLGNATVPLAMLVLGGMLAETQISKALEWRGITAVALVKLLIVPVSALVFLRLVPIADPVVRFIILLEGTMPPATNISIIVRRFGGETDFVATTTFVTYLACLFTVPLWLLLSP